VTIEPEFSLDQPRQINHLAPDGLSAKDSHEIPRPAMFSIRICLRIHRSLTDIRPYLAADGAQYPTMTWCSQWNSQVQQLNVSS